MNRAFTLAEALVVTVIFGLVVLTVYAAFILNQRASREGAVAAELTQNGRVILERMTREIRQAKEIKTELPATSTAATIEFEDGHDTSYIHYIRYFEDEANHTIKREVLAYYFSGSGDPKDPNTYVTWDATPPEGEDLATTSLEAPTIIGEKVSDLKIWMSDTINIFLTLKEGEKTLNLATKIYGRNL